MARFDWDRLRRVRHLDGADARVDADGTFLWERERPGDEVMPPFGSRRLRLGVFVRRRTEPPSVEPLLRTPEGREDTSSARRAGPSRPVTPRSELVRCPDCGALVARRKRLRHARRCASAAGEGRAGHAGRHDVSA